MKIIFDGLLVDIEGTACTPTGWLIGSGIFETLRSENGLPYAFNRHMQRAYTSAQTLGLKLPEISFIRAAVDELLSAEPQSIGHLRISFDVSGHWAVAHLAYQSLDLAARVRLHPDAIDYGGELMKSYPYEHRLAILKEAKLLGFDEAIVYNRQGNICEGAVTNLIVNIDGAWITPPIEDGVLPGIMRELVIQNCDVKVASLALARIDEITSAILLSSLRIAQSIDSIEGGQLSSPAAMRTKIHAMVQDHWVD